MKHKTINNLQMNRLKKVSSKVIQMASDRTKEICKSKKYWMVSRKNKTLESIKAHMKKVKSGLMKRKINQVKLMRIKMPSKVMKIFPTIKNQTMNR